MHVLWGIKDLHYWQVFNSKHCCLPYNRRAIEMGNPPINTKSKIITNLQTLDALNQQVKPRTLETSRNELHIPSVPHGQ